MSRAQQPRLPKPLVRGGKPVLRDGEQVHRVRVWDPVNRRQYEENIPGLAAALARQDELEATFAAGKGLRKKARRYTVHEAFKLYVEQYKLYPDGTERPRNTWVGAQRTYAYYIHPAIGTRYLDELDLPDLHDVVEQLTLTSAKRKGEPASPSTREKVSVVLKGFFRWCHYRRMTPYNLAAELKVGWGAKTRRKLLIPSLPMVEQQATLMESILKGTGDIVRLMAYTAMRWEEASALLVDDVDLVNQIIYIRRTASVGSGERDIRDDTKSDASWRTIVIPDVAMLPLKKLIAHADGWQQHWATPTVARREARRIAAGGRHVEHPRLVVTGVRGGYFSYSTWTRTLAKARAATEDKLYSAHELRHVCASILIATPGLARRMIANQMGHAKVETTENIYAHLFSEDLTALREAINATVSRLWVVPIADENVA